ncbi:putative adenylate cyclase regulatory protein [Aphidius gifuensis]|uniref:putative adenylate cyclase regulatory protein n=1 Tax=Aphidius gifuensis TaxID=684658 RepID=UPI001CDD3E63|nr:putative adenylate cyclase regulatory protein [Aphidius gifuensis]
MLLPVPERIDMEKVCTKWKEACQLAWYDIKEYKCKSSIGRCYDNCLLTQPYLEEILLRCGNYLKELSLSNVCNSSIMPFVGDHCKNLTTLECKFNDDSLIDNADHFVQAFTQLDKLKCIKITVGHNCSKWKFNLSAIIDSFPEEINEIHLFSEPICDLRVRNISMSVRRFGNLQKLTLVGIFLNNINFQEIADLTTLVYLSIGLQSKRHNNHSLFNKLVNLEYIDVKMGTMYYGDNISTEELETIFCTCKNLKHLDIPQCSYTVAGIPLEKWINFQNLQHLGISCHLTPELANTIVKYCKNLKHLRIPNYYGNNTYSLKKLTELENLECLILGSPNYLHEESIIAISNNCKKLKRLEIPDCDIQPAIDDLPLSSPSVLDELSKLQYLEHLNLRRANNLEDSTIIAIANNCKNLKKLDIRDCKTITKTALVALTNLKNLQILNVSYLDNIITNSFIIKLTGLKELDCSYCRKLTNSGIIQFIKNNPDLEFLNVCFIEKITANLITAADKATKNRTNGIILHIRISNPSIIQTSKSKIKSQWLVVGSTR